MESPEVPTRTPERRATSAGSAVRVSDSERDAIVERLQAAFAQGRLDNEEFDTRMRAALVARTRADLDRLLTDLPADTLRDAGRPVALPPPGRLAIAYKNAIRRGGRWRVPERFTTVIYKGSGRLDLRAAELTGPVTTIRAVAYKSDVEIVMPPGVRVEMSGIHVTKDPSADEIEGELATDSPVVHIRGVAYKGTIEVRSRPGRDH